MIVTFVFVTVCSVIAGLSFRQFELTKRRESLFGIAAIAQKEQANVLEGLPDVIVIASKDNVSYLN